MFRRLASTSARLAELPSNVPSTATGLGFAQRSEKRVRNLDLALAIPQNSGKIVSPQTNSKSRPQPWKGLQKTQGEGRKPQGETPKYRKPRAQSEPTNDEFFAEIDIVKSESMKKVAKVDMATPRYERDTKGRGKGKGKVEKTPKKAARMKEFTRVVDNSPAGLFGRVSLLTPVRKGAADLRSSMGAQGVDEAEARRQEVRRLAGDYSLFAPVSTPATLSDGRSKDFALRVLAQNPQLGLRAQQQARGVLDSLMR